MKNFTFLLLFTIVLAASSCNQCVVCDFNGVQVEHCKKDFAGGGYGMYEQTIREFEDAGYTCTEK